MTASEDTRPLTLEEAARLAARASDFWPQISGTPQLVMHRENTVFRVATTKGDAALRIHRAGYHTEAAILSELEWMAHLAGRGIPVPAPIPTANGDLAVSLRTGGHAPRTIDMLAWLGGAPLGRSGEMLARPREDNIRIFRTLGKTMGQFHDACDHWQRPAGFSRHAWDADGLVGAHPFWGSFWDVSNLDDEERAVLRATRDKARDALAALQPAGADFGLIHADLVRENVLVEGGRIHMIDFDDAGHGFRMFDIATALFKNRSEPDFTLLKEALIAGYLEERPFLRTELETLPLFMLLRSLTYLGWAEARKGEPGMDARQARFKEDALALARDFLKG